jgi:hypothetical protein
MKPSTQLLRDWSPTDRAQLSHEEYQALYHAEKRDRSKHLIPEAMWFAPSPWSGGGVFALLRCDDSDHSIYDDSLESYYWIAVRRTSDMKAFELVRIDGEDEIVEQYPGRYDNFDDALLEANSLSYNWDKSSADSRGAAMDEDRDLSRNLKLNPWAHAVWERKHPDGPVCVVWQMEPLPLYIAGWVPFAGARVIPSLVQFGYEADPARVASAIAALGEQAYEAGPSSKMIERAQSISAAYAANGRKGGRPKGGKKKSLNEPRDDAA